MKRSKVTAGNGNIIMKNPGAGREPYIIWDKDEAYQLIVDLDEAFARAWPVKSPYASLASAEKVQEDKNQPPPK